MIPLADLATSLEQQKAAAGLEVVGWCLADPANAVPLAESLGVVQHVFRDDLRTLWLAADIGRQLDTTSLRSFCRAALDHYGFWDSGARHVGMLWSEHTLAEFFGRYFPSATSVRYHARKLVALDQRQRRAARLILATRRALAGAA